MKRFTYHAPVLLGNLLIMVAILAGSNSLQARTPVAADAVLSPRAYLPLIASPRAASDNFDMASFIVGDGRLYEVWHSSNNQARHQTQFEGERFYHTKGENTAEWEELWIDDNFVYRGTDSSPGGGLYYTLRDNGQYGSRWSPRHWQVGDIYERNPWVTFYNKSNCQITRQGGQRTWLLFEAYHPKYTFASGITVEEVVVLAWLTALANPPEERYFYARDFGLVGWQNIKGDYSFVSEVHWEGARPDNDREVIHCLDTSDRSAPFRPDYTPFPLDPPYRAK